MTQPPTTDDRKLATKYAESIEFNGASGQIAELSWTRGRRSLARRRAAVGVGAAAVLSITGFTVWASLADGESTAPVADSTSRTPTGNGIDRDDCPGGVSTAFRYAAGVDGFPSAIRAVEAEVGENAELRSYDGIEGAVHVDVIDGDVVSETYRVDKFDGGWEVTSIETCLPWTNDGQRVPR